MRKKKEIRVRKFIPEHLIQGIAILLCLAGITFYSFNPVLQCAECGPQPFHEFHFGWLQALILVAVVAIGFIILVKFTKFFYSLKLIEKEVLLFLYEHGSQKTRYNIARKLETYQNNVKRAVMRLEKMGLLEKSQDGTISLTETGKGMIIKEEH